MSPARRDKTGAWMVGIAAWASIIVPIAVDWNSSHLFNDNWPSHAKLHDAMSFLMSIGLGVGALWLLHTRARRGKSDIWAAGWLSIWSWASLLLAKLAPGATYENPAEGLDVPHIAHVPILPNAVLAGLLVAIGLWGAWLMVAAKDGMKPTSP